MPLHRRSSKRASCGDTTCLRARAVVMVSYASAMATILAPSGMLSPFNPIIAAGRRCRAGTGYMCVFKPAIGKCLSGGRCHLNLRFEMP